MIESGDSGLRNCVAPEAEDRVTRRAIAGRMDAKFRSVCATRSLTKPECKEIVKFEDVESRNRLFCKEK